MDSESRGNAWSKASSDSIRRAAKAVRFLAFSGGVWVVGQILNTVDTFYITAPSHYSASEMIGYRSRVIVRAIRPEDQRDFAEFFGTLSTRSVHRRFLGFKKRLNEDELREFTAPDFVRHVAIVALLKHDRRKQIVGDGRYLVFDDGRTAEVALAVSDHYQGEGVGRILFKHLGMIAWSQGIRTFEATAFARNERVVRPLAAKGARIQYIDNGLVRISMPLRRPDARLYSRRIAPEPARTTGALNPLELSLLRGQMPAA